jgi:5-methylcytosine-specific restriction endonuclease McrA
VDARAGQQSRCARCFAGYKATRPEPKRSAEGLARRAEHQQVIGTARWRKLAQQVKMRDGGCVRCHTTLGLTVHHVVPVRTAPELAFDPSNLVTLCRSCHARVERRAA